MVSHLFNITRQQNIIASNKAFLFSRLEIANKKFFLAICGIILIGLTSLMSVGFGFFAKQVIFMSVFMSVAILIATLNIRIIYKLSYLAYFATIILLFCVFFVGDVAMGARRWLDLGIVKLQPSEFIKIGIVLTLARYYNTLNFERAKCLRYAVIPLCLIIIPSLLILRQPDLGTSFVIISVGVVMIFLSGLRIRYFIIAGLSLLIVLPFLWGQLHDYQRKRVEIFLDPQKDPLGSGYNIIQSKIAVGSGGIFGKGFGHGTQIQLDFLPEKHTDFIFTSFSEEFGLIGCLVLCGLYCVIIFYGYYIALNADNHFVRLLSMGISCLFFVHAAVNIGMTLGLLPVVGIPLPIMSYGGSITALSLVSFGLLMNCDINKSVVFERHTAQRKLRS